MEVASADDRRFEREVRRLVRETERRMRRHARASLGETTEVTRLRKRLRKMDLRIRDMFVERSRLAERIRKIGRSR